MTPEITAICVTRGTAAKVRLAWRQWRAQTIPCKLMLVHQGLEWEPPTDPLLTLVEASSIEMLGALRNRGLDRLDTEYWAQWDDDDLHHPMRLELQLAELKKQPLVSACMLSRWTLYDAVTDRAWISWARAWEGSIVAHRTELRYPNLTIGEDTCFVDALGANIALLDMPGLYVYRHHGANTYSRHHFMALTGRSRLLATNDYAWQFAELERET